MTNTPAAALARAIRAFDKTGQILSYNDASADILQRLADAVWCLESKNCTGCENHKIWSQTCDHCSRYWSDRYESEGAVSKTPVCSHPTQLPSNNIQPPPDGADVDMKRGMLAVAPWLSAAADDPNVCAEMKEAIKIFFKALERINTLL